MHWSSLRLSSCCRPEKVRLAGPNEQWPDGFTGTPKAFINIEVTEVVEPGRRRGDEYRPENANKGSPSPGDSFWKMLDRKKFNPTVYEKNFANGEKKVDVAIAHRMSKDAYTIIRKDDDDILLVAGDSDFVSGCGRSSR
jgi:hypothetical protein